MTGDLRVKNGIWQMRFSWKDRTDKWQRKEESTRLPEKGNKQRAKTMLKERLRQLEQQTESMRKAQDTLFIAAMKQWLDDIMAFKLRPNTLTQYLHVWKKHISTYPLFQGLTLGKLTPAVLQSYVTDKAKAGLSPETIKKHHTNINKFLNHVWRLGLIAENPANRIELPPRNRQQKGQAYTAEQVRRLFTLFEGDPLQTLILLTATYGLRRSEICALKWDAVDFDEGKHGCFYICRTAVVDNGKVLYQDLTKTLTSKRKFPLTPSASHRLKEEWRRQAENRLLCGQGYDGNHFVCCWDDGSPIRPDYVTRHYNKTLRSSELPEIQFRNLRDTSATILHRKGFDPKSVQGWMGHADVSTTLSTYIHFAESEMEEMAQTMEKVLGDRRKAV